MALVSDEQLLAWFPNEDPVERELARDAADAYILGRCVIPAGLPPADLVQAERLLIARYLSRRNSPDGMVGMSEFGPARITTVDADVRALIGPYRRVVFG